MLPDHTQNENASDTDAFVISGFADEIDHSLSTQLNVLEELGIGYFDLRRVDDTNVLDLTDEDLESVRESINKRGIDVSAIGSPIGKISITEDFEPHKERFERALSVAAFFNAPYIRVFSYYIPDDDDPAAHRESVMRRMQWKSDRAKDEGVTLILENEKGIYGDTPERCRDILTTVDSANLRVAFDPANFLEIGIEAYPHAFTVLAEYIDYLHVKDAKMGERGVMQPAGAGDAKFEEIVYELKERGFHGFASLEPHLKFAGESTGMSGPDGFKTATVAFQNVLDSEDIPYS